MSITVFPVIMLLGLAGFGSFITVYGLVSHYLEKKYAETADLIGRYAGLIAGLTMFYFMAKWLVEHPIHGH